MTIYLMGPSMHLHPMKIWLKGDKDDILNQLRRERRLPSSHAVGFEVLYPSFGWLPLASRQKLCDAGVGDGAVLHIRSVLRGGARGKSSSLLDKQPTVSASSVYKHRCPRCGEAHETPQALGRHLKKCTGIPRRKGTPHTKAKTAAGKLRRTGDGDVVDERGMQEGSSRDADEESRRRRVPTSADNATASTREMPPPPPPPPPPSPPPHRPPAPEPERILEPTRSGRQRKFPAKYNDFLPTERIDTVFPAHLAQPASPSPALTPRATAPPTPSPSSPPPLSVHPTRQSVPRNAYEEELEREYQGHLASGTPPSEHIAKYAEYKRTGWFSCDADTFGVRRDYPQIPSYIPDEEIGSEDACDGAGLPKPTVDKSSAFLNDHSAGGTFAPFQNATIFRLMKWFYSARGGLSIQLLNNLIHDVILQPDFCVSDLAQFSAEKELERMDKHEINPQIKDGWQREAVKLKMSCEKTRHESEDDAPTLEVPGILYRPLLSVIRNAFTLPSAKSFHFFPFRSVHESGSDGTSTRLHGECYTSKAMLDEHEKVQSIPFEESTPPNLRSIESIIAAIFLYSDATALAQFGSASLWPIYLWFGNQSKYARAKLSSFAAHHLAYMPTLPDDWQDTYYEAFGRNPSAATATFLKRELIHAIWDLLLDEEFMHAYEHGIILECLDGIFRRIFPRFFAYSADYPEKVLLASIKSLALCGCHRCKTAKAKFEEMGTSRDKKRREEGARTDTTERQDQVEEARGVIFQDGASVNSKAVEKIMGDVCETPQRNTFSWKFLSTGMNYFSLFVVDLMHEFELGVWKATFIHLLRLLQAHGHGAVEELNRRYRKVPAFGRDTIRKIKKNVSELKQVAARDYEDYLQCAIPVFECLLPSGANGIVLDLLFILAVWHAQAKLRMHTDVTLDEMETNTSLLGKLMRRFKDQVCSMFRTKELPRETAARGRRATAASKKSKGKQKATTDVPNSATLDKGPQYKEFNMNTFKYHSMPYYVPDIRRLGTTDNYSTQTGEMEHRRVKRFASRTSKKDYASGISKHVQREGLIQRLRSSLTSVFTRQRDGKRLDSDPLPRSSPTVHHDMATSQRNWVNIYDFEYQDARGDPAAKDFSERLRTHLLHRLGKQPETGDSFSDKEHGMLNIIKNRLYIHKCLRINYTTYDIRRDQDVINPSFHSDIHVLARDDDDHPFWYARVLGIFHVNIIDRFSSSREAVAIPILWVRWYNFDKAYRSGWAERRLHRIGFVPGDGPDAFNFINPADIVRASHLIPAFALGLTRELLPPSSLARPGCDDTEDADYARYYVNMFSDRDMFMRYRGGGIGHKGIAEATRIFLEDREVYADSEDEEGTIEDEVMTDVPTTEVRDDYQPEDMQQPAPEAPSDEFDDEFWDSDAEEDGQPTGHQSAAEEALDLGDGIEEDSDLEEGYGAL
ncbi:uncharacterized protein SCHCODRAFT_02492911 [Schizophyllum commune H4-8]|nr:uncharacterized protein SCHCODRAFT_02492911 [Schizophyllum commune H4-8]KAI5896073.1 hypothetical protein SCHCODRAFT_02492911 [Schizophyllum commune H4-8]